MIIFVFMLLLPDMEFTDSTKTFPLKSIPSVCQYFQELEGDLTKVVWAHAVNDLSRLRKALSDPTIMMIEADVVLGFLKFNNGSSRIPIMAHPPAQESDLSLQMFLEITNNFIAKNMKKGIKLDFKSTESFDASWKVINLYKSEINFPVFLNADIISGPVNSLVKPVDPEIFLSMASKNFGSSTLSIGWTTSYGPGISGVYSKSQLENILCVIKKYKIVQPVTVCFRAGIVAQSHGIKDLLNNIDKFQNKNYTTATIWMSSDSDPVDVPKLNKLILELQKIRVYLDVPEFLTKKLSSESGSSKSFLHLIRSTILNYLNSFSILLQTF